MTVPTRAVARRSLNRDRDSRQFRRTVPGARRSTPRGIPPTASPRRVGGDLRHRRLVDAFRRACSPQAFPARSTISCCPTLISFLICVIVVGLGVYAVHATRLPRVRIGAGALAMGLGVSAMHYVGMSAVHLAGPTYQEPRFVVASIVVAICASGFAVFALGSRPNRPRLFAGAIVLGLAISGMHYTAMAGMRLDPLCFDVSRFVGAESALSRHTLALLATVISFGVSGAFLLSLVPDSQPRTSRLMTSSEALAPATGPAIPIPVRRHPARRRACARGALRPRFSGRKYPRREGWPAALHGGAGHLCGPRQCPLHFHPRRREGIFLQSIDQRAGGRARPIEIRARPSQLHRSACAGVAHPQIGRSRSRGAWLARALRDPGRARPISRGQSANRGAAARGAARQLVKTISLA